MTNSNNFSDDTLLKLIEANKNDTESLDAIFQGVQSFEHYHSAIFNMEMKMKIYGSLSIVQ
jgi:hypothetical protein